METEYENAPLTDEEFAEFYAAYVTCLLWSTLDNDDDAERSLDWRYDFEDAADDAQAEMESDIRGFVDYIGGREVIAGLDYGKRGQQWSAFDLAGHDFALTRNRHGAGFWDRGLGEVGDRLTEAAHTFGSQTPYADGDEFGVE